MWRWMVSAVLLCCVGLPVTDARADAWDSWRIVAQRAQDGDDSRRREGREEQRERRRQSERQEREYLTPDERRELNRDLQRANREIYRKGREKR